MAVINRTLDNSQQRFVVSAKAGATATGVTGIIGQIETPCVLDAAQMAAFGISGAPTVQLVINRFIVGTGFTAISVGGANAVPAFGTSGVMVAGASLNAAGSTLLNLIPNDVIMYQTGAANAAVTGLVVNLVLRPIQDIKKYFNGLV
jgi:hypothetical protein